MTCAPARFAARLLRWPLGNPAPDQSDVTNAQPGPATFMRHGSSVNGLSGAATTAGQSRPPIADTRTIAQKITDRAPKATDKGLQRLFLEKHRILSRGLSIYE